MIKHNTIYNENCLDTMKKMKNEFIDLVITSPPYDKLRKYTGEVEWSFDLFKKIANALSIIIKKDGIIVWVVGDSTINGSETGSSFRQALFFKEIGFKLYDTMIYSSKKPPLTHKRYEQEFEYMFIFCKTKPRVFNPIMIPTSYGGARIDRPKSTKGSRGDNSAIRSRIELKPRYVKKEKIKGNIWNYKTGGGHSSKDNIAFNHPAIFPEKLAEDHILSWTNEEDLVYDPMAGSGTVAKMCLLNNRNFICSEISSKYCDIIKERINL